MKGVLEAAAPELVVKAGGAGAKLRLTEAVPGGGEFWATLAENVSYTANRMVSLVFGLVLGLVFGLVLGFVFGLV